MTDILRAHWPLGAALALGVLLGWMLFHPRAPAVHEKIDEHLASAKAKQVDKDTATETTRDAGPTRKVVLDFDPHCPPAAPVRAGEPLPPSVIRQTIIETGPTQVVTRAATEVRATEQVQTTEDRHLDLQIQPPAASRWAVQAGLDDVLHARTLRLAGRMRVVGPFWAELAVSPGTRSVGAALAVEW